MKQRYAGNNLVCVSCHVDAGGRKFGNPRVGTFVSFPQYRGREDAIATTEERINGCMERSMNGQPLPLNGAEMKAMLSYLKSCPPASLWARRSTAQSRSSSSC
ncbi:MAG: c-type cytochrome [Rubrivivax sp.]